MAPSARPAIKFQRNNRLVSLEGLTMKAFMTATVLIAMGVSTPVAAQPPNDDFDNAIVIPSLSFSDI